ncbi:MAG: arsenic resistance N-acetyltransferase ArsN2 [Steroidobacteraceae bacterium]
MVAAAAPPIRAATAADLPAIRALLQAAALPVDDLSPSAPVEFLVADHDGLPVGAIGLERHGSSGLLRSLVVAPSRRGRGLAGALVAALERRAAEAGIERLVLLTTTAGPFFAARGYRPTPRDALSDSLRATPEFQSLCPAPAACLARDLSARARDPHVA